MNKALLVGHTHKVTCFKIREYTHDLVGEGQPFEKIKSYKLTKLPKMDYC